MHFCAKHSLKSTLTQMLETANSEVITLIDEKALAMINDKRRDEKKN